MEYKHEDLEHDAALFLRATNDDFSVWSQRYIQVNCDLQRKVNAYASELRILSHVSSLVTTESDRYRPREPIPLKNTEDAPDDCMRMLQLDAFVSSLPRTLLISTSREGVKLSTADTSYKQLKRDVERDNFVINGTYMSGPKLGIDFILSTMVDLIGFFMNECGWQRFSNENALMLCQHILRVACRTNSGGATFLKLQEIVDPSTTVIVPDSKLASPLKINISMTATGGGLPSYGISTRIKCSTVFSVLTADQDAEMEATPTKCVVEGVYENVVFCSIDPATINTLNISSLSESVMFLSRFEKGSL